MRLPGGGGKTKWPVKRGRLRRCHWRFFGMPVAWSSPLFCPIFQLAGAPLPRCRRKCTGGSSSCRSGKIVSAPPATQKGRAMCLPGGGGELAWPMSNPFPMKREGGASRSPLSFGLFVGTILQTGPSWLSVRQKGRSFPARNRLPSPGVFFCLFFYLAENPEPADNVVDGGREGRGPDFHRVLGQPQP